VDRFVVDRFSLGAGGWTSTPAAIADRAGTLLYPAPGGATVIVQSAGSGGSARQPA
jgi:hypothetical protein